jgi:hypothetical protein
MPKEDPLDEAFYELKNIINMLQANLFRMVSKREVMQSESLIDQLMKTVEKFEIQSREELKEVGLTHEQQDMLDRGKVPDSITGEHKEALKIAIDLKKKIEDMRIIAHKEQGLFEEEEKESIKKTKQEKKDQRISKQQHKKKFKRLGGDDWKPL